jgi:hypothetical protein
VALVRTDVSEEYIASIIRIKRISEVGASAVSSSELQLLLTINVVSSLNLSIVMMEEIYSSEKSIFRRTARRHIPEDGILLSYRRESLKSYSALTGSFL